MRSDHMPFEVKRYTRKTPASQWAVYIACAIGFVAALIFNNFSWM